MSKTCEMGKCPPDCKTTELVVTCSGSKTAPSNCSGMQCRFRGGLSSAATYDGESQTFSCKAPPGLSAEELLDFKLFDGEDAFVCDVGDCPAMQRCDSAASSGKKGATNLPACVPAAALGLDPKDDNADDAEAPTITGVLKAMSFLDRYLAVWVLAAMVIGVLVGYFAPGIKNGFDVAELAGTSLPIAIGLWLMMWPVLAKVRYELIGGMLKQKGVLAQIGVSLMLNWLIGPLLMTGLAWATLFDLDNYRNGVILVGLARCIAMVLLWNQLAKGNAEFCAILVAVNSVMQIILYAPLALFYLKVVSRQYQDPNDPLQISFWIVARSVLIFLGAPLAAAILTRIIGVWAKGREWYDTKFAPKLGPIALVALLYSIFVIFSLQGRQVIDNIGSVFRVAVPMLLYFTIMWLGTFFGCWRLGVRYEDSVVQAFTASSNNFELAIAVAVGVFGINSAEALAATVGPLIEVPVLLGLVYVALAVQRKFGWK